MLPLAFATKRAASKIPTMNTNLKNESQEAIVRYRFANIIPQVDYSKQQE